MPNQAPLSSLSHCFASLNDPRIERHKHHQLIDILTIAICAIISGADNWVEIEEFGKARIAWFHGFVELANARNPPTPERLEAHEMGGLRWTRFGAVVWSAILGPPVVLRGGGGRSIHAPVAAAPEPRGPPRGGSSDRGGRPTTGSTDSRLLAPLRRTTRSTGDSPPRPRRT